MSEAGNILGLLILLVLVPALIGGGIYFFKSRKNKDIPGLGPRSPSRPRSLLRGPLSGFAQCVFKEIERTPEYSSFAVVGLGGSGKSTFIDTLRRTSYGAGGSALTDVNSYHNSSLRDIIPGTQIQRLQDPNLPITWYEYPTPNTVGVPREDYFLNQGLHLFSAIMLLVDVRLMEYDIGILQSCVQFGIPCFLIRSKSDQHIRNIRMSLQTDDDDSDDEDSISVHKHKNTAELESQALQQYIELTRSNFRENLDSAGLTLQRFYLVSSNTLRGYVRTGIEGKSAIDEAVLLKDLKAVGYHTVIRPNTTQLYP